MFTLKEVFYEKKASTQVDALMATQKGLEPSTPGVTGRYSNQLSY